MRYVRTDDVLDASAYLATLPELAATMPRGAHRFAADPDHYDGGSVRCVHDLELGRLTLSDEPGGHAELHLVGNAWKHDGNLTLRYEGLRSSSMTVTGSALGHRALGDLMLDELLPHEGGVRHELEFEAGLVVIVADDVTHEWIDRPVGEVVYVFTPEGAHHPAGIWPDESTAGTWIAHHGAVGTLSTYEVGTSAYEAAVARGRFRPTRPEHETPAFEARFTTALDHWRHGSDPDEAGPDKGT